MVITGGVGNGVNQFHNNFDDNNFRNNGRYYEKEHITSYDDVKDIFSGQDFEKTVRNSVEGFIDPAFLAIFGFAFVVILVIVLAISIVGILINAFLINPLMTGIQKFFVKDLYESANVKELAYGFDENYKNIVKVLFLRDLFNFLWSLLFIVPGIIKAYEYRMMVFIMTENPEMEAEEVFALSKKMMTGQKWNAFVLDLSFLGWHILDAVTCGLLGIFFVTPYQLHTNAALYESLKRNVSQA